MCNRHVSPDEAEIERAWHVGARDSWRGGSVFPRKLGPFVRSNAAGERELVVGPWGLIPFFAKTHKPDPKLGPDHQDKRSVVVLEPGNWDAWLRAPQDDVQALVRLAPPEVLVAVPEAS